MDIKSPYYLPLIGLGAVLNTLLISLPFFVKDGWRFLLANDPAIWAYYILLLVFYLVETRAGILVSEDGSVKDISPILPYLVGMVVLWVFWISLFEYAPPQIHITQLVIASCMILCGVGLRYISITTLQNYFTSKVGLREDHELITHGVYARLRHPSEVGLLLICFGIPLLLSSPLGGLFCLVILVPLTLIRISLEDRLLANKFGDTFLQYKMTTKAFWPIHLMCNLFQNHMK